jgi:universal stress protein F
MTMYRRILVPVDLQHVDALRKALATAAELAHRYGADVWYVAVTGKVPNRVAKSPEEFTLELEDFAAEMSRQFGLSITARSISSVDMTVELDDLVLAAAEDIGADLIVMASHAPGVPDRLHLIRSNAAYIVRHANISVFVVR